MLRLFSAVVESAVQTQGNTTRSHSIWQQQAEKERARVERIRADFHLVGMAFACVCAILAIPAFVVWILVPEDRHDLAVLIAALLAIGPLGYLLSRALGWWASVTF